MKNLLLLFTLFPCLSLNAQNTFSIVEGVGAYVGTCLSRTSHDGFIVGAQSGFGGPAYVACFDSVANIKWEKHVGDYHTIINSIVTTSDSTYLVCISDSDHISLVNFNETGDTINTRSISFSGSPEVFKGCKTNDGGVIFAGRLLNGSINDKMLLVKVDPSGTMQWAKSYTSGYMSRASSVIQLADSSYLVTGYIRDSAQALQNACILKLSSTGNIIWQKIYNTAQPQHYNLNDVLVSNDSLTLLITTGSSYFIVRADSMANIGPAYGFNLSSPVFDPIVDFAYSKDSSVIVATETDLYGEDPGVLFKMDMSGNVLWSRLTIAATRMITIDDGGILILASHYGSVSFDMGIMKGDSLGQNNTCWITGFVVQPYSNIFIRDSTTITELSVGQPYSSSINIDSIANFPGQGCVYVRVDEFSVKNSFDLYPNPIIDRLFIETENRNIESIYINDLTGRNIVQVKNVNSSREELNMSSLAAGIYNVVVVSGSERITKRFVKLVEQ